MGSRRRFPVAQGGPGRRRRRRGLGAAILALTVSALVASAPAAQAVATPVASAPATFFPPVGTTFPWKSTGVVPEVVSWTLIDAGPNGFSHFELEQFNTYASSWNLVYYGTGTTYQALLPVNQFTEFRLTPFDLGGAAGVTTYGHGFVPYVTDDSDPTATFASPMAFAGGWTTVHSSTAFGGTVHTSTRRHAKVTFCGAYSQVALIGARRPIGGTGVATVFGTANTVSFAASSGRYREVLGRWRTPVTEEVPGGDGPTYCFSLTAQSAKPVSVDAIAYNVPDIIE